MKNKLTLSDIKVKPLIDQFKQPLLIGSILMLSMTGMTGCLSDTKACSDSDVSADPPGITDIGVGRDPTDLGVSDTDSGTADPAGNGDVCSDFD